MSVSVKNAAIKWRGPNINSNGLVLYADPGSPNSYYPPINSNILKDISGNNLDLTINTPPLYSTVGGGSLLLNGSSNYIDGPDHSLLELYNFTFSCWVRLSTIGVTQYIMDSSSNGFFGYGYSFRVKTDNIIRFWAYDANDSLDGTTPLSANTWYNVTVTYENTNKSQKIYINGVLDNENTHNNTFLLTDTAHLRFGNSGLFGGYLNGYFSTILAYNRELTQPEILKNFNELKTRFGL